MINDNELRKGNWVIFDNTNKRHPQQHHVKVLELKEKEVVVLDPVGLQLSLFYQTNSIRPIPLTPEVLEKCGFTKDNAGDWEYQIDPLLYLKMIASMDENWYPIYIESTGSDYKTMSLIGIKHLHQLQNLYWILTQTEIEYKP